MRPATDGESELMEAWLVGFHHDALREEPDLERIQKLVQSYNSAEPQLRGLRIWDVDGQPVSMVAYSGPTPNGIRIGSVYTPPEQRKQGYASALTAEVSQYLLDQGHKFVFLFTDLLNPTSNHIYQEIGYKPVCDVDRIMFR
jgi:predicted GNAT family acetyltransferase